MTHNLNLIENGGFEQVSEDGGSPLGWSLDRRDDERINWGLGADAHSGRYALEVRSPGLGESYILTPKFKVSPKASYILSFWTKSDRPSTANVILLFDSHPAGVYHYEAKPKIGT